jgi:hypothetical protein
MIKQKMQPANGENQIKPISKLSSFDNGDRGNNQNGI